MPLRNEVSIGAIPAAEWSWSGMPGHFIASTSCCFHLVTDIDCVRVSTVGCYHRQEEGEPNYENRHQIGAGRLYETFVFELDGGEIKEWSELDSDAYNDEDDANAGHMAMCRKWAALGGNPARHEDGWRNDEEAQALIDAINGDES